MKRNLLIPVFCSLLFSLAITTYGQPVTGRWFINSGSDNGADENYITTYPDGSVCQIGSFTGPYINIGDIQLSLQGSQNIYISRVNETGEVKWAIPVTGNGYVSLAGFYMDAGGNLHIVGNFNDSLIRLGDLFLTDTTGNSDYFKPFVAIVDDQGNPVLLQNPFPFDNKVDMYVDQVGWDKSGALAMCGMFSGDSLYTGNVSVKGIPGMYSFFVFAFAPDIKAIWGVANTFDMNQGEPYLSMMPEQVLADPLQGVTIAGHYFGVSPIFGDDTLPPAQNGGNLFTIHFGADGQYLWGNTAVFNDYNVAVSVLKPTADGGFYLSGKYGPGDMNFGGLTLANTNNMVNYFVYRLDASGHAVWARELPVMLDKSGKKGSQSDLNGGYINRLLKDPHDNFYITGYFLGDTLDFPEGVSLVKNPGHDAEQFVARYNPEGTLLWAQKISSNNGTVPAAAVNRRNDIFLAGRTYDTLFFENDTLPLKTNQSMIYIVGFDENGSLNWSNQITENMNNAIEATSLQVNSHNSLFLCGTFSGTLRLNTISLNSLFSQNIYLANLSPSTVLKGNIVTVSGTPVDAGNLYLIKLTREGEAPAVNLSSPGQDGSFVLRNFLYDNYLLYFAPLEDIYPYGVGTYYGDVALWTEADTLRLFSDSISGITITMTETTGPLEGEGTIEGGITSEAYPSKKSTASIAGEPIKKVKVILIGTEKSTTDDIIAWVYTDDQGHFFFQNVPDGNYRLFVDIPGLPMESTYSVAISVENNVISGLDFIVTDKLIKTTSSSGVAFHKTEPLSVNIYPNPTGGRFRMSIPGRGAEEITLFDNRGSMVHKYIYPTPVPDTELDLSGMPAGIYYLRVRSGDATGLVKLIIQH